MRFISRSDTIVCVFNKSVDFSCVLIFASTLPWPEHRPVRLAVAQVKIFLWNLLDHNHPDRLVRLVRLAVARVKIFLLNRFDHVLHLHRHGQHHRHHHRDPYVFYKCFHCFYFKSISHTDFHQKWAKICVFFLLLSINRVNASNQNQSVEIKWSEK